MLFEATVNQNSLPWTEPSSSCQHCQCKCASCPLPKSRKAVYLWWGPSCWHSGLLHLGETDRAVVGEQLSAQPWREICLSFNSGINNIAHSWCFDLVRSLGGLELRKAQGAMPGYDRWMPVCVILQRLPRENCFSTLFSTSADRNQCITKHKRDLSSLTAVRHAF